MLYTDSEGKRRLRVITRKLKTSVFLSRFRETPDDPIENMNTEYTFMVLVRQLLLRFGESNLEYIQTRATDVLSSLLKIFRERSQKFHKITSFVMPPSMNYLPYYIYSFLKSVMIDKTKLRKLAVIEYYRRELFKCDPARFLLLLAPELYMIGHHWYGETADKFVIPPKSTLVDFVPDKNRKSCSERIIPH